MEATSSGDQPPGPPGSDRLVAHPIVGWSNRVTFHDVCRECGRRVTGFVCDGGRMTPLHGGRWAVEMRWQHDGEGALECDVTPAERGRWPRTGTSGPDPAP